MKNPYILSRLPEIPRVRSQPVDELRYNLGNFMFLSSVSRFIKTDVARNGMKFDPAWAREACDGIVIPAANWLQAHNDYSGLAKLIESADLPTVITGLGAQSLDGSIPQLQPGMLRFLKAIADRSHSLSVRGTFSAEVLEHHGIKNVEVTGCPSLLWHVDRPASVRRRNKKLERVTLLATVPGEKVPNKPNARMVLAQLIMKTALLKGWDFVMQTEIPFLLAQRGLADEDTRAFNKYVFGEKDYEKVQAYLKKNMRYFGNAADWIAYSANQDTIIGSRLHGVIAGLLAGTPSVLVTHDTRTVELGEKAKIPTITSEELQKIGSISPEQLLETADFAAFNRRQVKYFHDFIDFFDKNEVPHYLQRVEKPRTV